jgi:hypothetical protein
MGESGVLYRILVGKPKGKRPPGRPRLRWEHNIKMDLQEVGRGVMDRIDLAQDSKIVASGWLIYLKRMMMHGLANFNLSVYVLP